MIAFSCGFCGAPLDENKEQIKEDAPKDYNPDDYLKDGCPSCWRENNQSRYITHEMALDAGDLSLEGQEL